MSQIKKYSSDFATKLMYVISLDQSKDKQSLVDKVCSVIHEKETTVRNWLFNGKLPRLPKRVQLSDTLGVSVDYLFESSIPVDCIETPKIFKDEGRYLVPFLPEARIFNVKSKSLIHVLSRIPVMFPDFDKIILTYGDNIFATKLIDCDFPPYIDRGSIILFTTNIRLEDYKFVLMQVDGKLCLRRILRMKNEFKLMYFDKSGDEVVENIISEENLLLILISFSI